MKVGDVAVVSSWNERDDIFGGLHTYAIQKTSGGLEWYNYYTYNVPNVLQSSSSKYVKDTVYATLTKDNNAYVVGYIVK